MQLASKMLKLTGKKGFRHGEKVLQIQVVQLADAYAVDHPSCS